MDAISLKRQVELCIDNVDRLRHMAAQWEDAAMGTILEALNDMGFHQKDGEAIYRLSDLYLVMVDRFAALYRDHVLIAQAEGDARALAAARLFNDADFIAAVANTQAKQDEVEPDDVFAQRLIDANWRSIAPGAFERDNLRIDGGTLFAIGAKGVGILLHRERTLTELMHASIGGVTIAALCSITLD